jgi:hypothetical protein
MQTEHDEMPSNNDAETNSRTVIVYRATSMFQCAIAAVMNTKNTRAICWIDDNCNAIAQDAGPTSAIVQDAEQTSAIAQDADAEQTSAKKSGMIDDKMMNLRASILSDNPHTVMFFDSKWPRELIDSMRTSASAPIIASKDDFAPIVDEVIMPIIVILTDNNDVSENIVNLRPRAFRAAIPCDNVISAEMIADYMFVTEYPDDFQNHDCDDANMFKLGLRGSTGSTLQTYAYIRDIVSNWQRVMEPEQLVTYGKVIANIGNTISDDHHKLYSRVYHIPRSNAAVFTMNDCDTDDHFVNMCYLEAPNQYTRAHPMKNSDFTIGYNISSRDVIIQMILPITQVKKRADKVEEEARADKVEEEARADKVEEEARADKVEEARTDKVEEEARADKVEEARADNTNKVLFAQHYFNNIAKSDSNIKTIDGIMYATISRETWFTHVDELDKIMIDLCNV